MSTSDDILLVERLGHVLRLSLNRPERRNAVNDDLILRLKSAFEAATNDNDIRAIVLTGAGDKAFCSGADLVGGVFEFDYSACGSLSLLKHPSQRWTTSLHDMNWCVISWRMAGCTFFVLPTMAVSTGGRAVPRGKRQSLTWKLNNSPVTDAEGIPGSGTPSAFFRLYITCEPAQ